MPELPPSGTNLGCACASSANTEATRTSSQRIVIASCGGGRNRGARRHRSVPLGGATRSTVSMSSMRPAADTAAWRALLPWGTPEERRTLRDSENLAAELSILGRRKSNSRPAN